jgi:hypothetical protein
MPDAKHLRDVAARMFAVAMTTRDTEFAGHLARRASDYLDQAAELERAAEKGQQPEDQKSVREFYVMPPRYTVRAQPGPG